MQSMWHMILSRGHQPQYQWSYANATCLCYLYRSSCDAPDVLWHAHTVDEL